MMLVPSGDQTQLMLPEAVVAKGTSRPPVTGIR